MNNVKRDLGPTLDLIEAAYLEAVGENEGRRHLATTYRGRAAALERPAGWKDDWDDEETKERAP